MKLTVFKIVVEIGPTDPKHFVVVAVKFVAPLGTAGM